MKELLGKGNWSYILPSGDSRHIFQHSKYLNIIIALWKY